MLGDDSFLKFVHDFYEGSEGLDHSVAVTRISESQHFTRDSGYNKDKDKLLKINFLFRLIDDHQILILSLAFDSPTCSRMF